MTDQGKTPGSRPGRAKFSQGLTRKRKSKWRSVNIPRNLIQHVTATAYLFEIPHNGAAWLFWYPQKLARDAKFNPFIYVLSVAPEMAIELQRKENRAVIESKTITGVELVDLLNAL